MHALRWSVLTAGIAVAAVLISPTNLRSSPKAPARGVELKELQGTWTLLGYSVDGRQLRGEDAHSTFTIEDDRWTEIWRKDAGGQQVQQGVVKIIDSAGQPRVMDLVHDFGPNKGKTTRILYQVEGDSMRYSILVVPTSVGDAKVITSTTTWKRKAP